jgi:serine/threonine protein kinase
MNCIRQEDQLHTGYDFYKADVFSIGMMLLEMASLIPSFECFDFTNKLLDYKKIQENMKILD